jgi:hypothetical protein
MATPMQVDPYRAHSRKSSAALVVGLLVLAVLTGFALGKGGLFGRSGEVAGEGQVASLSVPGQANPVPIQATDPGLEIPTQLGFDPSTPDLNLGYDPQNPNVQLADKMPPEVRAWLLHLERTERERQRLSKAHIGQALAMLVGGTRTMYDGLLDDTSGEMGTDHLQNPEVNRQISGKAPQMRQGWKDLDQFFNSKQPPVECIPIKNAYEQCLDETGSMMRELIDVLEDSGSPDADLSQLMQRLTGMQGQSAERIDVYGHQTDGLVGDICQKYEAFKWFSISGDIGGGLGSLGLGGIGGALGDLGGLIGGG